VGHNTNPAISQIRVFVVDDHPVVRRGLQSLLSLEPNLTVCGEADSANLALEKILSLRPDVVIIDLALKGGSGLELIKQLRAQCLKSKLLVFSIRADAIHAERALRAGADGYITKEEGTDAMVPAIRLLIQGKRYVSDQLARKLMDSLVGNTSETETAIDTLTDRELEILELIGTGLGSRAIAQKLHLSVTTIASHREHLKAKLGLPGAAALVSYAFNWVQGERSDLKPERLRSPDIPPSPTRHPRGDAAVYLASRQKKL